MLIDIKKDRMVTFTERTICNCLRRVIALFIATILMTSVAAFSESSPLEEETARIFKKYKTVGGMLVVAKDGEIVFEYCYGLSNKVGHEPVTPDTYFKIASVSKLVTAVSVMKLVETGRLDLDENIGHYLGNPVYEAANPKYPKTPLTVRTLMTHTAGINDGSGIFTKRRPLSEMLNPKKNKSWQGFNDQEPGTKYTYSNYGAGIIGCVLEAVTGMRLTNAARELLFDPMEIDAAYNAHLVGNPEKIVTTYKADGKIQKTRSYRLTKEAYNEQVDPERDYTESYGSVWIKGRDLCRIGVMLCDMGVINGQRILEKETVLEMISSQQGKGCVNVDSPYGLNVERHKTLLKDKPNKIIYGHQGLSDGILCNLYFDPETRFVFALVTNGCNTNAKQNRICSLARSLFTLMWDTFVEE